MSAADDRVAAASHWRVIRVGDVILGEGRVTEAAHVARIRQSYERLGGQLQLQPIVVDSEMGLIDGAHRLEAARQSEWSHIAALVCERGTPSQQLLIELEASRTRKALSPLELEQVWRVHYEPEFRARTHARRAAGLRRGAAAPVHANCNNGDPETRVSIAKSAKQITGLSLRTLDKVAEVRELSSSAEVPDFVREAAALGLTMLARPGASVDPVHRELTHLRQGQQLASEDQLLRVPTAAETSFERQLIECSMLAERLSGPLAAEFEALARLSEVNREQLRALRVALAHSLATVVSIECRLEAEPIAALRRIGAEVGRLLSQTSVSQLNDC